MTTDKDRAVVEAMFDAIITEVENQDPDVGILPRFDNLHRLHQEALIPVLGSTVRAIVDIARNSRHLPESTS